MKGRNSVLLIGILSLQTAVQRNMLLQGAVAVSGTQDQEVVQAHGYRGHSLLMITTPSARPIKFDSPPPRLPCSIPWWLVTVVVALVLALKAAPCCCLEARCPPEASTSAGSYCECTKERIRSGFGVNIRCDFHKKEVGVYRGV